MISTNYGSAGPNTAALSQMRQQMFAKLDANSDGGIDETEFVTGASTGGGKASGSTDAQAKELFASFDGDSDGKLTQDELETGFQKLSDQMRATLIGQQETSGSQRPSPEERFAKLDSNSDGGLDEAEFVAGAPQKGHGLSEAELKDKFASYDTDGNGSLTASELDAGIKNSRASGAHRGGGGAPQGDSAGGSPPSSAPVSATTGSDSEDTLMAMLKELADGGTSNTVNRQDLDNVLSSFLKLQESQVSQTYSATA